MNGDSFPEDEEFPEAADEFADPDQFGWQEDDAPAETVACPACGAEIYEESEQCPACGEFIVHDASVLRSKPGWYVLLAVLGVVAVIAVLSGLLRMW